MSSTSDWFYEMDKDLDQKISNIELRIGVYLLGVFLTPQETQELRILMANDQYGAMDEAMFTSFFPDSDRTQAEKYLKLKIDRHIKRLPSLSVTLAFFLLFVFAGFVMVVCSSISFMRIGGGTLIVYSVSVTLYDVLNQIYMRRKIVKLKTLREIPPELNSTVN